MVCGPWIPAISAFTRVHSPSKTGVNALNDALCAGMNGVCCKNRGGDGVEPSRIGGHLARARGGINVTPS
jgi:hypothetical protein